MKVVLFCGGMGMRLKEYSELLPKPMVEIGYRPILWHLMRYYAYFGHKDFILCLGYRGDLIKKYFLNYAEWMSNDFVLSNGGKDVSLFTSDIGDWTISFIDTGLQANIGQRLNMVEQYLEGESVFMANYADGLTSLNLPDHINHFYEHGKVASFLCVQPSQSFHVVAMENNSLVKSISPVKQTELWVNGGFFIFRKAIFEYLREGEELVMEPFQRLINDQELIAYRYKGFWAGMDTFKEKQMFDDMYARGETPWAVWKAANVR
jgi:glucose-1-phosphate cytidylyltransferase